MTFKKLSEKDQVLVMQGLTESIRKLQYPKISAVTSLFNSVGLDIVMLENIKQPTEE